MLSTLLAGGLPLVPALDTAAQSIQSRLICAAINDARQRVREGQSLSHSMEETKLFPDLAVEMVEVGESTGALPPMLISVAEFYEEDVQNALTAAMSLIEPLIMIFMGFVVAFILISLYLADLQYLRQGRRRCNRQSPGSDQEVQWDRESFSYRPIPEAR